LGIDTEQRSTDHGGPARLVRADHKRITTNDRRNSAETSNGKAIDLTLEPRTHMDLPTRCALLIFALLNHLDRLLGLQHAPQPQRIASESIDHRYSSSKKESM
jgi:hypothetical protein